MVDFYGFHVGVYIYKYTSPMDPMGIVVVTPSVMGPFLRCAAAKKWPKKVESAPKNSKKGGKV